MGEEPYFVKKSPWQVRLRDYLRWKGWQFRGCCSDGIIYGADLPTDERHARNVQGRREYFGGCDICGDNYHWKAYHYIGITHAFPYCEECHRTASRWRKIKAMLRLVKSWHEQLPEQLWTYRGFGGYVRVFLLSAVGILLGQ